MNVLKLIAAVCVAVGTVALEPGVGLAQQPQIPTLQACNPTTVSGKAEVFIQARQALPLSGVFRVAIKLSCNPSGNGYPSGTLEMRIDMSDSTIVGNLVATTFEQATTTGKHTPTTYLNGRCKSEKVPDCRFWMMLADNKKATAKGTPDVIGFLVFNAQGGRVAYGTGPVREGDISIAPTSF